MNEVSKLSIAVLVGALLGAGVSIGGSFIVNKFRNKEEDDASDFEERRKAAIERVEARKKARENANTNPKPEENSINYNNINSDEKESVEGNSPYPWGDDSVMVTSEFDAMKARIDEFNNKTFSGPEDYEEYMREIAETQHPEEDGSEYPYVISEEEYTNENLNYDKFSYVYYAGDATLVDDNENPINADTCIGEDNVYLLNTYNVVYIRNDQLGSDYEITRADARYIDISM